VKTIYSIQRDRGFNLIEVLAVIAVLVVLMMVLLPEMLPHHASRAPRIQCVNNLKQVGLAYRIWEGDHGDKYPMELSQTNGGTMEFINGPNAFRHFQVLSNELGTPRILFCPAETDRHRFMGTNFNINNSNLSYFAGVDASETNVQMILAGDRNITNGLPVKNSLLEVDTNHPSGWTAELHNKVGNIALADGSVQQLNIQTLRTTIQNTGLATNRLQMPTLNP
jgi:prepilin-type N-terminal cleavage/methylation domain-containing protein/prepilin-type processing-associated H-X9-DG protein